MFTKDFVLKDKATLADGEGFEPPEPLRARRFSRPVQ